MKDAYYFPHDYNARGDEKITKLIRIMGLAGYGLYWVLVEKLYEAGGKLAADYDTLAFDMRVEQDSLKSLVEEYDLFYINGGKIGSGSVDRRLQERQERSELARKKGVKSGQVRRRKGTTVEPRLNSGSTSVELERKGKERTTTTAVRAAAEPGKPQNEQPPGIPEEEPMARSWKDFVLAYPESRRDADPGALYAPWEALAPADKRLAFSRLELWQGSWDWKKDDGQYIPGLKKFIAEGRFRDKPKDMAATPQKPKACHSCAAVPANEISLRGAKPSCKPCLDAEAKDIEADAAVPLTPAKDLIAKAKTANGAWESVP